MGWREDVVEINEALHRQIGEEPCASACLHRLTDRWTLLGLANTAARARDEAEQEAAPPLEPRPIHTAPSANPLRRLLVAPRERKNDDPDD